MVSMGSGLIWLSTALAGPLLVIEQFPGDGAVHAEEFFYGLPVDACEGEGIVKVAWDVADATITQVRTTPDHPCLNQAVLGHPPKDLVDGHYVGSVDYALEEKLLLAILGTTGESGAVEDLWADGGDYAALDAALGEVPGVAVAAAAPKITVVRGPESATFAGEIAARCDGREGSGATHRVELIFMEGHAKVQSVSPKDAFATCLEVELSTLRHGAYSGPMVIDVVGTH